MDGMQVPLNSDLRTAALHYIALGLSLIELKHGAKGPISGQRWSEMMTTDPDIIDMWLARGSNIGVVGGEGHVWIDCDVGMKHGRKRVGISNLNKVEENYDMATWVSMNTLAQRSPTGGRHYLVKVPFALGNSHQLPADIDVRGTAGYVVCAGSVLIKGCCGEHDTPGRYELLSNQEPMQAPEWLLPLLRPKEHDRVPDKELVALDQEHLAAAVPFLPDPTGMKWEEWNRVVMALYGATGGSAEGEALFDQWSSRSDIDDPGYNSRRWAEITACPPATLGAGTVFHMAAEGGWVNPIIAAAHADPGKLLDRVEPEPPPRKVSPAVDESPEDDSLKVHLMRADRIEPRAVAWIWDGWLARGKYHLWAGVEGDGKSTLTLDVAATITTGGLLPDGRPAPRGSVLMWSGEDGIDDTLLPRFIAAGGDRSRMHFISYVSNGQDRRPFDPSYDLPILCARAAGIKDLLMLIIDPLVVLVRQDSHQNAEVRRGLQPFYELLGDRNIVGLGISHLRKDSDGSALNRVLGSKAFTAAARGVGITARNANGSGRVLIRAKSNLGPDGGAFTYDTVIVPVPGYPGLQAQVIRWGSFIDGRPEDILERYARSFDKKGDARHFLLKVLMRAQGAVPVTEIKDAAAAEGITERTLERAARALKVTTAGSSKTGWTWELKGMRSLDLLSDEYEAEPE